MQTVAEALVFLRREYAQFSPIEVEVIRQVVAEQCIINCRAVIAICDWLAVSWILLYSLAASREQQCQKQQRGN